MNWGKITAAQFESLCCEYANTNYSDFTWVATKQTRDGNKDGEFCEEIKSINRIYKGWYEAKYTKNLGKSIPYAHMDSTLVSGILDGQVVYILFITNGRITQEFKRRANAILQPHKIEVNFIDGELIEEWLLQNPEVYNAFFEESQNIRSNSDSLNLLFEDVCFFDGIFDAPTLSAPIDVLSSGNDYYLYLGIKSNFAVECNITINTDSLMPYSPTGKTGIRQYLQIGYNSFFIKCKACWPYQGKLVLTLKIVEGGLSVFWEKKDFIIKNNYIPKIIYSNQTNVTQQIFAYLLAECSDNSLLCVCGHEGSGKSYLIRKLLESLSQEHNECLVLQFSEKKAENACTICKLILFLNFGYLFELSESAFAELISSNINLSLELFLELRNGTKNQITALHAIQQVIDLLKVSTAYAMLPVYSTYTHKHASYICVDDLQKLDKDYSQLFQELIEEFVYRKFSQIMICGYRPSEFYDSTLEQVIKKRCQKQWVLGQLSSLDIKNTMTSEFNQQIGELTELFPSPLNVLHLVLLMKQIRKKNIDCLNLLSATKCYAEAYNEINAQNNLFAQNKLRKCRHKKIIYLVYKIETGIPENILINFLGELSCYIYTDLQEQNIIKIIGKRIYPFHDAYLYSFKSSSYNTKEYLYVLNEFLEYITHLEQRNAVLESNLISILLEEGYVSNAKFKENAIKFCKSYYNTAQYSAARYLAKALLPNLDTANIEQFDYETLELLYIYAQCVKSTESHAHSTQLFRYLIQFSNQMELSGRERTLGMDSLSEILNNELWLLHFKEVEDCLYKLENLVISSNESHYMENAYLNYLNRKMMYQSFINDHECASSYEIALNESKRLQRKDYIAYANMDYAKTLYCINPKLAINLLCQSMDTFNMDVKFSRRLLECEAELVFLNILTNDIAYDDNLDKLYELQKTMLTNGYIHSYTKTTIKILTIELVEKNVSPEIIEKRLNRLLVQNPDLIENQRMCLYFYQLQSALCYIQKKNAQSHILKHEKITSKMAPSYKNIPWHNKNLTTLNQKISWAFKNTMVQTDFWIDPRLW